VRPERPDASHLRFPDLSEGRLEQRSGVYREVDPTIGPGNPKSTWCKRNSVTSEQVRQRRQGARAERQSVPAFLLVSAESGAHRRGQARIRFAPLFDLVVQSVDSPFPISYSRTDAGGIHRGVLCDGAHELTSIKL